MKKHIKKINTLLEYNLFISSYDSAFPNVSYISSTENIFFNKTIDYDYEKMYLTFTAVEDGRFTCDDINISYSLDNGITWCPFGGTYTPTISKGSSIILKGSIQLNKRFSSSGIFDVSGNIVSIIAGDNFKDKSYYHFSFSDLLKKIFRNTKIRNAHNLILPITNLEEECYSRMFYECSNLISAPSLPATTLAEKCYYGMFENCTSLTTAPELPATTLAESCYQEMFRGCTSLTIAPELPATQLQSDCYTGMFYGCSNLNKIVCFATNTYENYSTNSWLYGVSNTGTFYKSNLMLWDSGISGIPSNWKTYSLTNLSIPLTFEAKENNSNIILTLSNYAIVDNVEYSIDNGNNWLIYNSGTTITLNNIGDTILFRGKAIKYHNSTFSSTSGALYVYGNIMSLLSNDFIYLNTVYPYSFLMLFYNFNTLYNHPNYSLELPATTLDINCYSYMFTGCSALTTVPSLPATTLANNCYDNMFRYCSNLTTASQLPATTLADNCYQFMFYGCTSLVIAPELPATTLTTACYNSMFFRCTNLTTAPTLPVTTLARACYQFMFYGCTSLTTAPELPATTLTFNCYCGMFEGCTNLTTAPELPATTLEIGCYQQMFQACTSLNSITCLATDISAMNCTYYWVKDIVTSGTFIKAANMNDWTNGDDGIPNGWTVQDYSS